ncbi:MAG: acyl--CoA ligase [Melioribacteraceae bacterium]|nr:acyl--CoA ligase [Melioribacteraceae bacterium]
MYNLLEIPDSSDIFIETEKHKFSYRDFSAMVNSSAVELKNYGIIYDEIVPVLISHNYKFVTAVFSLWYTGAIPVPVSIKSTHFELNEIINSLNARHLITDQDSLMLENIHIIRITEVPGTPSDFSEKVEFNEDNDALILYSSGTTGKSKPLLLNYKSFIESYNAISKYDLYSNDDRFLASLPFNHIGGFSIIIRAFLSKATLLIPDSTDYVSVGIFMQNYNPSIMSVVPTSLKRMLDANITPGKNLRSIYVGGAASDNKLISKAVEKEFPVVKVYGSTETCAMVCAFRPAEEKQNVSASGYALGDNKIYIRGEDGKYLANNQPGEVVVRSKSLFKEYYNDRAATVNAKKDDCYFSDDLGFIDENGLLTVVGRVDDVIISGGEKIFPGEIENELMKFEEVMDCCVIGIPDDVWGQKVTAYVVVNDTDSVSDQKIKSALKTKLTGYKIPKIIYIVDSLPYNSFGKIDRKKLNDFTP